MSLSMKCVTGALALGLSACALGTAERVPSLLEPSNPEAAESPMWPLLALRGASTPTSPQASAPPSTGPTTGLYVCPMHRDVTAHELGRCPKCGMRLVLQAPSASPGGTP